MVYRIDKIAIIKVICGRQFGILRKRDRPYFGG
jgi:hypothetical protein